MFEVEAPGQKKGTSVMEFIAADDDSATVRSSVFNASDEPVGKPSEGKESWEGLRRHAAFPRETTTIEEATITVPAGTFVCKLYTVVGERDGRREVRRFHFANALPGPPVRMTVEVDGELVHAVTMLESGSRVKEE